MGGGGDHKEKTTKMVLKVDLQCPCCYKKVKKVLCKMPQVINQEYDEKANTVTITVVCCSPQRIRDKLCCKGGKAIQSIEIKDPKKDEPKKEEPKGPEKTKPAKKVTFEKAKELEKSKEKAKETEKPKDKAKEPEKPKGQEKPTVIDKPKDKPKDTKKPKDCPKAADPIQWKLNPVKMKPQVQGYPQAAPGCGCWQCYYTGGPCYQYYGTPVSPPPAPYYGNHSYEYGLGPGPGPALFSNGKGFPLNNDYFHEENAQGCTIM